MSTRKPGMMLHVCKPSYSGGLCRTITVGGQPEAKPQDLSEKELKQKGLGHNSSGRVPA
jgi:hypothetical protein